jgi:phosphatidylserine/phosphatidylglycerophosphate/cardiolipin synthase-like enzyme
MAGRSDHYADILAHVGSECQMGKTSMQALLEQLELSIADSLLSPAEKRELSDALRERPMRVDELRQLRNHAFKLVKQRAYDSTSAAAMPALIDWLAAVIRVIDQVHTQIAVRTQVWFSPGQACLDAVLQHLRQCRQSMDICVFTIADDRITEQILAAHRRGVTVRVISDNDKREDRGSDIETLAEAGIVIALDRSDAHMHHKFALFDGQRLLNGSFNWTRSASRYNDENLVSTNDPVQLQYFSAQFEALWQSLS